MKRIPSILLGAGLGISAPPVMADFWPSAPITVPKTVQRVVGAEPKCEGEIKLDPTASAVAEALGNAIALSQGANADGVLRSGEIAKKVAEIVGGLLGRGLVDKIRYRTHANCAVTCAVIPDTVEVLHDQIRVYVEPNDRQREDVPQHIRRYDGKTRPKGEWIKTKFDGSWDAGAGFYRWDPDYEVRDIKGAPEKLVCMRFRNWSHNLDRKAFFMVTSPD